MFSATRQLQPSSPKQNTRPHVFHANQSASYTPTSFHSYLQLVNPATSSLFEGTALLLTVIFKPMPVPRFALLAIEICVATMSDIGGSKAMSSTGRWFFASSSSGCSIVSLLLLEPFPLLYDSCGLHLLWLASNAIVRRGGFCRHGIVDYGVPRRGGSLFAPTYPFHMIGKHQEGSQRRQTRY